MKMDIHCLHHTLIHCYIHFHFHKFVAQSFRSPIGCLFSIHCAHTDRRCYGVPFPIFILSHMAAFPHRTLGYSCIISISLTPHHRHARSTKWYTLSMPCVVAVVCFCFPNTQSEHMTPMDVDNWSKCNSCRKQ